MNTQTRSHPLALAKRATLGALLCLAASLPAHAQEKFPSHPLRIIVTFAPGGPGDILARALAVPLGEELGQPVIVENRAGGDAVLGTEIAAKAAPDGYTLLQVTTTQTVNMVLKENLKYDLLRDFLPVARVAKTTMTLVTGANSPYRSVADLVAAGKTRAGGLSYGSGAAGSVGHLSAELFKRATGINGVHIPYKGAGPVITELAAGRLDFFFGGQAETLPPVQSGLLRALAVTATQRVPTLPNTPTMVELGFAGFDPTVSYGYMVPAGTPAPVVKRLHEAMAKALTSQNVQTRFQALGVMSDPGGPEEFAQTIKAETARWGQIIKAANIRSE